MPRNKLIYIARDANREAQTLDVPFGKFADPVGEGVKRALAVFFYARSQGKEREFMLACGNGSWAEAIDIATDEGLREVTEKAGLFWPDVLTALEDDDWKAMAEANREELTSLGLWGVPSYRFEDACMWGQDRAWLLARKLEDRCHDGDGIMT